MIGFCEYGHLMVILLLKDYIVKIKSKKTINDNNEIILILEIFVGGWWNADTYNKFSRDSLNC